MTVLFRHVRCEGQTVEEYYAACEELRRELSPLVHGGGWYEVPGYPRTWTYASGWALVVWLTTTAGLIPEHLEYEVQPDWVVQA